MKRKLGLLALLVVLLVQLRIAAGVDASSIVPPPPPATPVCNDCSGPPPPPTPVPTLAPTMVPQEPVVAVQIAPTHVQRGHMTTVVVTAPTNAAVTLEIQYKHGKRVVYKGKVGDSGTFSKSWRIPKSAPVGQALLEVTVAEPAKPYSTKLTFVVTR